MPEPKSAFDATYPCDFYEPAELFEPDQMYTIPEIGRLLQGLEPDAEVEPDTEAVLVDWAVPWVMVHADDMVVAEPLTEDGPGYYGLATDEDHSGASDTDAESDADSDELDESA
ncbi:DUF5827 family protein [Halorubrum ezzemoulense]|uniref:DUF5827 family protein n=1 Tax=Halorubrum ezzemoulense TaxID=337243 RepID=UPI00232FD426|nr:DUF5827 family protein [Halorubrum ezzemoulense]MDB9252051.1 DUF5827 family protein [Halorubrum ezzemoulense]MDB9254685.1 DUF5827 family protein [Halorubrum ezzemoulense]MDB9275396.1 DUF5827 family protein [Halorubrum ezzemoulense]